jgi:hypothetical protein
MARNTEGDWEEFEIDALFGSTGKGPGSASNVDKRARHTMVERKRRDKTRAFTEQLQSMLPNISERRQNPNLNFVLEKTLEYLQSDLDNAPPLSNADDYNMSVSESAPVNLIQMHLASGIHYRIDDFSKMRNLFTFDNAPFGIVIARSDGVLLKVNDCFRNMFVAPQGPVVGHTMFTLTSSRDLPITMKVNPAILSACCALWHTVIQSFPLPNSHSPNVRIFHF